MAPSFRYRYVDFGTVFTGDTRSRGAESAADSPATLFANELATGVGGTCWGSNEPLSIIDHHFARDCQFPSAAAAVLHKAKLIRDRFAQQQFDVLWLVTHQQPDFDAFCSMYLARWIIESPDAAVDWQDYGLHPDGWLDLPNFPARKFAWFNPDLSGVPAEHRWPLLLASYASMLDSRRRISCPRKRALHSILSAALKRGRDYQSETSGATELFDEVRASLSHQDPNPIFDSVLEHSTRFAPELAMLDREAEAYERDIRRARKSIVYLPQSEAPSPNFFKSPKDAAPLHGHVEPEVNAERLLLADTFRIASSGIYLRDPECSLFQEWARLDVENSPLGAGFDFTAIATSQGRPAAVVNHTDYVFSIDPERANGRHLYTVWSRLQTKEVDALRAQEQRSGSPVAFYVARGAEQRTADTLLADPWFGGPNSSGTAVSPPNRGTAIGPPGARSDLRDDLIAEEVRTELENPVYSAESLVAGPQVTVVDFPAAKEQPNETARHFDLNAPLQIPPPLQNYFRFASIGLRADVPILPRDVTGAGPVLGRGSLAQQVGETLWQVLYPHMPGALPADFAERHLVVTADSVGVWADRGVAIARKRDAAAPAGNQAPLRDDFAGIVSLARDIDLLTADAQHFSSASAVPSQLARTSAPDGTTSLEATIAQGEELARRAAELQHILTLPDRDLLRRFAQVIGVDRLVATLRDLNHTNTGHLRRLQISEQEKRAAEHANIVAKLRSRLEWLEIFAVTFLAIEIVGALSRYVNLGDTVKNISLLAGGPAVLALTAWLLKPWKRKPGSATGAKGISQTILFVVIAACALAWLASLLPLFTK